MGKAIKLTILPKIGFYILDHFEDNLLCQKIINLSLERKAEKEGQVVHLLLVLFFPCDNQTQLSLITSAQCSVHHYGNFIWMKRFILIFS